MITEKTHSANCGCVITHTSAVIDKIRGDINVGDRDIHAVLVDKCPQCTAYEIVRNTLVKKAAKEADEFTEPRNDPDNWNRFYFRRMDELAANMGI